MKNNHMTHLEDLVLFEGREGAQEAVAILDQIDALDVATKWDGSPSIFAGPDPETGEFFVATKSIFNKTPKVYKTKQDIYDDLEPGDLRNKMLICLEHLPSLKLKCVLQGDLLFTSDSVKTLNINGRRMTTFQPNTIIYAYPWDRAQARVIRRSKLGVVWHTAYAGDSIKNLTGTFSVHENSYSWSADVWSIRAIRTRHDSVWNWMDRKEEIRFSEIISAVEDDIAKLEPIYQKETIDLFLAYHNSQIRNGSIEPDVDKYVEGFIDFITEHFSREMNKRKTEKGKEAQMKKMYLNLFRLSAINLEALVRVHAGLSAAKACMINTLDRLAECDHYVRTEDGLLLTKPEGYVVSWSPTQAVKLVDRLEFSAHNFSDKILKGYER